MGKKRQDDLFYGLRLTEEQEALNQALMDDAKKIIFVDSVAGTGKTTIAVGCGYKQVKEQKFSAVHYLFSTPCEKKLGYTPGGVEEKESKYLIPLFDAIEVVNLYPESSIFELADISCKKADKPWVSAHSINYMRGVNLRNSFVIIDEAQNMTVKELKMVLTRIHDDSKVIVIGHHGQCDIDEKKSGFVKYREHFRGDEYSAEFELTQNFRGVVSRKADML